MKLTEQLAKHFRDCFVGGSWTVTHVKEVVADITLQQATAKQEGFNTIAALLYHINYFVEGVTVVLNGGQLLIKDKFSFDVPAFENETAWKNFCNQVITNGELFAQLISQLPDEKLNGIFVDEKYGTYYRNFSGILEHTHYHLGQIVILKKILQQKGI